MFNNVINAWWPLVFYPATDAPKFRKGMFAMIGVSVATLGVTAVVWALERREKRERLRLKPKDSEEDINDEDLKHVDTDDLVKAS